MSENPAQENDIDNTETNNHQETTQEKNDGQVKEQGDEEQTKSNKSQCRFF